MLLKKHLLFVDGLAWKVYLPPEVVNSQRLIEIFFFFSEWEGVCQQETVRGLGESACFMKKRKRVFAGCD